MSPVAEGPDPRMVPEPIEHLLRVVGRSVVENNQFPVREDLRSNALDRVREKATVVVAEDIDRDRRPVLECQDDLPGSEQELNDALARRSGSNRVSQRVAF